MTNLPAGKRLPDLLMAYSATAIRRMVEQRGLELPPGTRKAAAVEALVADAVAPESVRQAVASLSIKQRALLELLLVYPGEVPADYIQRVAAMAGLVRTAAPNLGYNSYYTSYSYRPLPGDPNNSTSDSLADLLSGLSARVLALTTTSGSSSTLELGLASIITVPAEVRPIIVGVVSPELPTLADPPQPISDVDPRAIHRALFLLWSSIRSRPAGLTQAGLVRKTDARRLGQVLGVADAQSKFGSEQDLDYLYFLRHIVTRLGLLLARDGNIEAADPDRLRDFLRAPWPQRSLAILRAWIEVAAKELGSLAARESFHSPRQLPVISTLTVYRRYMILLAGLPNTWVRIPDFVRWMRLHHFGFLALDKENPLSAHDLGSVLYIRQYGGPVSGDIWDSREGRAIRESLIGPLHWLGAVELGGPTAGPQAFRLTEIGRAMLAALSDPARESELAELLAVRQMTGRVVVQPNFQVLVVGDVPDETLFAISEVAELVRAERAIEFKLTRESVYSAQQAGWTPLAILDLLRGATRAPLAQNVERSILDWAAAHERIIVRRDVTLLAARDPELLDRLAADPTIAPLFEERLLPTLALVSPGTTGELNNQLLDAGELPSISEVGQDRPAPSFEFDDQGRVIWKGALPDLRLLGLLASVMRTGPGGELQLDERTVRATTASRRWQPGDVLQLLDDLAAWYYGPLPSDVARKIKIWTGFQGSASLRDVTLLTVDRPEILTDLLADPLLGPLLNPLAQPGTVALVRLPVAADRRNGADGTSPASIDTVRQELLSRGFTLSEEA